MSAISVNKSRQSLRRSAAIVAISLAGTFVASTIAVSPVSAATNKSADLAKFGDNGLSVERLQQAIAANEMAIIVADLRSDFRDLLTDIAFMMCSLAWCEIRIRDRHLGRKLELNLTYIVHAPT